MLPNIWQLSPGGRILPLGGHGLAAANGVLPTGASWEDVLALAQEDGWHALYDPTNPNTRTIVGSNEVSQIQDSLGNLPALAQSDGFRQPQLIEGEFGGLDGMNFQFQSGTSLVTNTFSALTQPDFVIILAKLTTLSFGNFSSMITSEGTFENWFFARDFTSQWTISSDSTTRLGGAVLDTDKHIHGGLYNGANSEIWSDGNLANSGSSGSNTRTWFRIGAGATNNTQGASISDPWEGTLGLLLYYQGAPSSTIKNRMFNLLKSITGIE